MKRVRNNVRQKVMKMLFMIAGTVILMISTSAFIGSEIVLRRRKRQLREHTYQIYE